MANMLDFLEIREWSIVLSFLTETEGVSLLLTRRRYAKLLPIFRKKDGKAMAWDALKVIPVEGHGENDNTHATPRLPTKHRHEFKVVTIQNSSVLLARLNTKRLYRRKKRPTSGQSTVDLAQAEWEALLHNQISVKEWYPPRMELLRFLAKSTRNPTTRKSTTTTTTTTVFVSYPRSGNTLLRTLWERVTGTVTGSDTRADRLLSRALSEAHDLVGEGVTSRHSVAVVKTHWPERVGHSPFLAHRAVLVVRNPYDAMDSYWNMNATCSHTKTLAPVVYQQFAEKWAALVRNETHVWLDFHEYWMEMVDIPVLVVRYEDLVQQPEKELWRVWNFVSSGDPWTMPDALVQQRIQHVLNVGSADQYGSYTPRSSADRAPGKSLRKGHISEEQVQYMRNTAAQRHATNYLQAFGYDALSHDTTHSKLVTPVPCASPTQRTGSLRLNSTFIHELRPRDCPFGRGLTKWRHSVTDNDTNPLSTV